MGIGTELRKSVTGALKWVREVLHDDISEELPVASKRLRQEGPAGDVSTTAAALDMVSEGAPAEPPVVEQEAVAEKVNDPEMYSAIIEMLHTVFDPEIPVDIYELGLIYDVEIKPDRTVEVRMTLTSPNCPSAQELPEEVKTKVEAVDGVVSADVEVVWEPVWTPAMMSEEARLELNM